MYGHNRAWGHYYCPFLLVFLLTKMAFNGGKWPQCLSQSLTWPLGPGVFLRPVPSCTYGVSVLLQFYPHPCLTCRCAVSHVDISSSVIINPNGPHEWPQIVFVLLRLFVFASVVVCLPGFCLFLLFCFWYRMSNWLVSEMMCEIELWHRKWRALNTALLI